MKILNTLEIITLLYAVHRHFKCHPHLWTALTSNIHIHTRIQWVGVEVIYIRRQTLNKDTSTSQPTKIASDMHGEAKRAQIDKQRISRDYKKLKKQNCKCAYVIRRINNPYRLCRIYAYLYIHQTDKKREQTFARRAFIVYATNTLRKFSIVWRTYWTWPCARRIDIYVESIKIPACCWSQLQ